MFKCLISNRFHVISSKKFSCNNFIPNVELSSFVAVVVFCLGVIVSSQSFAQAENDPIKLNPTLAGFASVNADFKISPDGKHVVYLADQNTDGVNELFHVPIEGGTPVRLNGPINGWFVRTGFQISPDSKHVVYLADQNTSNVWELFSVPIEGGTPVRLNAPLVSEGDVSQDFRISPDSQRVIYIADQNTNQVFELFSVPILGGSSERLNLPLIDDGESVASSDRRAVSSFQISSDSNHVIFEADQSTDNLFELFSVPIEGGTAVLLSEPVASGRRISIGGFKVSLDSKRVVFSANQNTRSVAELFSVPIEGGPLVQLNKALVGAENIFEDFLISSDSQHVVYTAGDDSIGWELLAVPILGGESVFLSGPSADGKMKFLQLDTGFYRTYEISPDSQRVTYLANQEDAFFNVDLFSVPITGGTPIHINEPFNNLQGDPRFNNRRQVSEGYLISPDSKHLIYRVNQNSADMFDLFSVPIDGGTPVRLNAPLVNGGGLDDVKISADSQQIVYSAAQNSVGMLELFSVPISGGEPVRLNAPLTSEGDVLGFEISADSQRIVYRADQNIEDVFELFSVSFVGSLNDDDICFPIKAQNDKVAVICL